MTRRTYTGTWHLLPELCFYEGSEAPEHATYEITVTGGRVEFSITWMKDGHVQSIEFGGPLDGRLHPSSLPPDSKVSYTHIDENTLQSAVFAEGARLAFARRQVSRDGSLMSVLQINTPTDGTVTRTLQVYRRVAR